MISMSADSRSPAPGPPETTASPVVASAPTSAGSGFGAIARKISSRTTDLIAISVVLVASLVFGRQVTEWWHAEPPEPRLLSEPAQAAAGWGADGLPVFLEFGNSEMLLTRQTIGGDRDAAVRALDALCRRALEQSPLPSRAPDAAETKFLAKLADLKPVAEEPGEWQLFQISQAMPLAAGVRWIDRTATNANNGSPGAVRRLICFGLALPAGKHGWSLFGFKPSGAPARSAGPAPIPLPEGARQIMSVRDQRGGSLVAFQGRESSKPWQEFFDEWVSGQGGRSAGDWTETPLARTTRFELEQGSQRLFVEIHLAREAGGVVTGLLNVVPGE